MKNIYISAFLLFIAFETFSQNPKQENTIPTLSIMESNNVIPNQQTHVPGLMEAQTAKSPENAKETKASVIHNNPALKAEEELFQRNETINSKPIPENN